MKTYKPEENTTSYHPERIFPDNCQTTTPWEAPQECVYLLKTFEPLEDRLYFRCDKFNKGNAQYTCPRCPDFIPKNKKK